MVTLSEVRRWDATHLEDAALHWQECAARWEDSFSAVHGGVQCPGGTEWHGEAAAAAFVHTAQDRVAATGAADDLRAAAKIARSGAEELAYAKRAVLSAVNQAQSNGFTVGENFRVTDATAQLSPTQQAARQAQAQTHAMNIAGRVKALLASDIQTSAELTRATAPLSEHLKPLDHPWKQDPPTPGGSDDPTSPLKPVHTGQDVKDVLGSLPKGKNDPVRVVPVPADVRRLYDWLIRNSVGDAPGTAKPYPGVGRVLDDGTIIRFREGSESGGPTIEVIYPDGSKQQVHLPLGPRIVDTPPDLSSIMTDPAPAQIPPPLANHPPVAPGAPPASPTPGLPPWLAEPSPPGFRITPGQAVTVPWDAGLPPVYGPPLPSPPSPPADSSPAPDSSIWDEIGDVGKDIGKGIGEGVAIGAAILGGIGGLFAHPLDPAPTR